MLQRLAVLALGACVTGAALAQVAGSVRLGVTVEEQRAFAEGWSAKNQIIGKAVYNEAGDSIGTVEDLIMAPDRAVTHAIVGAGGFLGLGEHDVLIPVDQFKFENERLTLPGATKETLEELPVFEYAR
jgi:hypothetical protein